MVSCSSYTSSSVGVVIFVLLFEIIKVMIGIDLLASLGIDKAVSLNDDLLVGNTAHQLKGV
jgi:hypothetical protein